MKKSLLIVILGPTASGKSKLAVQLAKQFNGEIVSADSRQIYKEMDIGTGKITQKEKQGVVHHLIDIIPPDKNFTLVQYKKLAVKKIKDIQQGGKLPFLVGGTGLYVQSIVDNLNIPQVKPNKKLRNKLAKEIKQKGLAKVYQKLLKLDPAAASFVDPHNARRIIRALEVCLITGQPFSKTRRKGKPLFNICQIGLKIPQEKLNKKIDQRLEKMLKAGLIKEVKNLLKKYKADLPALSGIGYQEIIQYLQGKISLEQAKELIKQHTRQYSRRQMTWFKKDPRIKWVTSEKQAQKIISDYLP